LLVGSFKAYSGHDDPRTKAVLILYVARIEGGVLTPGDDAIEAKFFPLDEIPDNIAFESHRRAINEYKQYQETGNLPDPNE